MNTEIVRIKEDIKRLNSELRQARLALADIRTSEQLLPPKSREELIKEAWLMPELPETVFHSLTHELGGFITGSTVYFSAEPNDLDIVVNAPPTIFEEWATNTLHTGYWEADGMTVVYAHYNNQLLNIICISDYNVFKAWYFATEIMKLLFNSAAYGPKLNFNRKWARVRVFRALRDVLTPVVGRTKPLSHEDAIKYQKCVYCHREAINFINKDSKRRWEATGVCDRCAEEFHV